MTAPTAVPRKKGASSDELANRAPVSRLLAGWMASCRKAKPTPRSTMPSSEAASGTNKVMVMAANALGNPVQSRTRPSTIHTWLPSHTGVTEASMASRARRPRAEEPAARSQMPPPKSAPANRA